MKCDLQFAALIGKVFIVYYYEPSTMN